jgi:hypothetical protein
VSDALLLAIVMHAAPTLMALAALVASIRGRRHTKAQLVDIHELVNGERTRLTNENEALRQALVRYQRGGE